MELLKWNSPHNVELCIIYGTLPAARVRVILVLMMLLLKQGSWVSL